VQFKAAWLPSFLRLIRPPVKPSSREPFSSSERSMYFSVDAQAFYCLTNFIQKVQVAMIHHRENTSISETKAIIAVHRLANLQKHLRGWCMKSFAKCTSGYWESNKPCIRWTGPTELLRNHFASGGGPRCVSNQRIPSRVAFDICLLDKNHDVAHPDRWLYGCRQRHCIISI